MYRGTKKKVYAIDSSIVDIQMSHVQSSLNYKPMTHPPQHLNASSDAAKSRSPNVLKATARYNFKNKTLALCFYEDSFEWSLVSLNGLYVFGRRKINQPEFIETSSKDPLCNFMIAEKVKAKVFKLDIKSIYRHILMKQFTVDVQYMFLEDINMKLYQSKYSFNIPYFPVSTEVKFGYLGHFAPIKSINTLFNCKFKPQPDLSKEDLMLLQEIDNNLRQKPTTHTNKLDLLKYALNIEDLTYQVALKAYSLKDVTIEKVGFMTSLYSIPVKSEQLPFNFKEMALCLVPMELFVDDIKINFKEECVFVKIGGYKHETLSFEVKWNKKTDEKPKIDLDKKYYIRFIPNRIAFRSCLQTFQSIENFDLKEFFENFQEPPVAVGRMAAEKIAVVEWFNKAIEKNEEQKVAIRSILNCTAYPFPYVVFGPPGTGKTSCIVECIAQILKHRPNIRIMVTAQSNSACDEIGVRLLKYVSWNKVFRYYSPSMQINAEDYVMPEILKRTSNLRPGNANKFPSKEEYSHFRVIIATLMSCSRLIQIVDDEKNRHFDYIFVDECGAAMEPESLVPIVGLGADKQKITSNIVLLGDYKQLGPLISSKVSQQLGLNISLMERIMSKPRYKSFDKNYVTQLLDNFRSHPAILQFSNVLFYESKLRAKIAEPEKSFGLKWQYLSNKKFPILFHCVKTPSQIEVNGNSSFNSGEIEIVRFYVELLLRVGINGVNVVPEDIGIVSPYKSQLNMLKSALRHVGKVEIGTAEYYQGREKKIIVISTVKSNNSVGFLSSEKRLNVCITRAKSLLILVGNADTLQQNALWNSFLHFCKANNAYCGESFSLKKLTDEEQKRLHELNEVVVEAGAEDAETVEKDSRNDDLKAIKDRLDKIKLLINPMATF